jgi:hypothetical protein
MLIHQKLWFVHGFDPLLGFVEYNGPDTVLSEIAGFSWGHQDGETGYWIVIPNGVRGEWCQDHRNNPLSAEIVHFDPREGPLTHLHNRRHAYLEGARIYNDD